MALRAGVVADAAGLIGRRKGASLSGDFGAGGTGSVRAGRLMVIVRLAVAAAGALAVAFFAGGASPLTLPGFGICLAGGFRTATFRGAPGAAGFAGLAVVLGLSQAERAEVSNAVAAVAAALAMFVRERKPD